MGFVHLLSFTENKKIHLVQLFFYNDYFLVIEPFVDRVAGVELDSKQRFSTVGFSEHGVEIFNFLCSCELNLSIAATNYILFSCATPNSTVIFLVREPQVEFVSGFELACKK